MGTRSQVHSFYFLPCSIVRETSHPIRLHLQGGCLQTLMCSDCNWMPDLSVKQGSLSFMNFICHLEFCEQARNKNQYPSF